LLNRVHSEIRQSFVITSGGPHASLEAQFHQPVAQFLCALLRRLIADHLDAYHEAQTAHIAEDRKPPTLTAASISSCGGSSMDCSRMSMRERASRMATKLLHHVS